MRLLLIVTTLAVVCAGCALRPRYADFVTEKTEGKEVTFLLTDTDTQQPVGGAKVELSELRNRVSTSTAPDGTFKLPVDKKYVEENSLFVVTLPKGVTAYRVSLAPVKVVPVPAAVPAVVVPPAEPAAPEATDAGTPASNG